MKKVVTCKEKKIRVLSDFLRAILYARGKKSNIFKTLKD